MHWSAINAPWEVHEKGIRKKCWHSKDILINTIWSSPAGCKQTKCFMVKERSAGFLCDLNLPSMFGNAWIFESEGAAFMKVSMISISTKVVHHSSQAISLSAEICTGLKNEIRCTHARTKNGGHFQFCSSFWPLPKGRCLFWHGCNEFNF